MLGLPECKWAGQLEVGVSWEHAVLVLCWTVVCTDTWLAALSLVYRLWWGR